LLVERYNQRASSGKVNHDTREGTAMLRQDLITHLRRLPAAGRVITALDVPTAEQALALAGRLGPRACFVKVGLELFTACGPAMVLTLRGQDKRVFLDLKLCDIPNTVAGAVRAASQLGVSMLTMHAGSGRAAMTAASDALASLPPGPDGTRPALLAVTVLTSLGQSDLAEISPAADTVENRVLRLARLAWQSGCDGIVCSAPDLPLLRTELGPEPLVVTPGIRPAGGSVQDQKRVATPRAAARDGADFLVVGRPITRAEDPSLAHAAIAAELEVAS
jgi:orotidine-5'-phosphate decarboxylase